MSYGNEFCPHCNSAIVIKVKNPKGPSICENGHQMDHRDTIKEPKNTVEESCIGMSDHEIRLRELDAEGIKELHVAVLEYHISRSKGRAGGAAMCVCGAGGGGSKACRGLAQIRDLLRYADWGDPKWKEHYEQLQRNFGER